MVRNYTLFHRKTYDLGDEEKPFTLSFCIGDVYASRDLTEWEARQLIRHIQEELGAIERDMWPGDLGLIDPSFSDIPF